MHEMSLAESMLEIIDQTAQANQAKRVQSVLLELGCLSHVDQGALAFAFEVVTRGSVAEGARLDVRMIPGLAWCMPCGKQVTIERVGNPCPDCGSHQLAVVQGEEMRIASMEIN